MKKTKRKIIEINEGKCNGCGLCIPDCPEGALQIIDDKARLVSDLFCDGLGACLGSCPQNAINIIEREAEPYDEKKVMAQIVKHGANTIKAHLEHLESHREEEYLNEALDYLKEKKIKNPLENNDAKKDRLLCGCPGSQVQDFSDKNVENNKNTKNINLKSELKQWPIQLKLVPANAPYFKNKDLVIAADCVAYSYANFHGDFLRGKSLVIGCPKLDEAGVYYDKITDIIKLGKPKSITVLYMEVPCCYRLVEIVEGAKRLAKSKIPITTEIISIKGEKMD